MIEATDGEGNVFGVFPSRYPLMPNRYLFETSEVSDTRSLSYVMDIEAVVYLGPAIELEDPRRDRECWSLSGLNVGVVDYFEASDWSENEVRGATPAATSLRWEEANWVTPQAFGSTSRLYSSQPLFDLFPTETSSPPIHFSPVDRSVRATEITRISFAVGHGIITGGDGSIIPSDCRSEYLPVQSMGGWIPLNDLLEGVMFYPEDDDLPWLWVRASNVRTVGR